MKMVGLFCPHCGAALSVENGLDSFYCQYCGGKILLTGQDKSIIDAKVKLKEFEHRERLQNNQYAFQERAQKSNQEYKLKKNEARSAALEQIGVIIMMIVLAIVIIVIVLATKD